MKKIIPVFFVILSLHATAQKTDKLKFSIGAELGAVTGNLSEQYSVAIGGTGQLDYMIDPELTLTLNTGIIGLLGKDDPHTLHSKYKDLALIPLLAGIKYYFTPNLYGSGQLGTSVSTRSGDGARFTYIPGIGYKFSEKIDALIKYSGYGSDLGTFGIRLGYTL